MWWRRLGPCCGCVYGQWSREPSTAPECSARGWRTQPAPPLCTPPQGVPEQSDVHPGPRRTHTPLWPPAARHHRGAARGRCRTRSAAACRQPLPPATASRIATARPTCLVSLRLVMMQVRIRYEMPVVLGATTSAPDAFVNLAHAGDLEVEVKNTQRCGSQGGGAVWACGLAGSCNMLGAYGIGLRAATPRRFAASFPAATDPSHPQHPRPHRQTSSSTPACCVFWSCR